MRKRNTTRLENFKCKHNITNVASTVLRVKRICLVCDKILMDVSAESFVSSSMFNDFRSWKLKPFSQKIDFMISHGYSQNSEDARDRLEFMQRYRQILSAKFR